MWLFGRVFCIFHHDPWLGQVGKVPSAMSPAMHPVGKQSLLVGHEIDNTQSLSLINEGKNSGQELGI